MNKRLLVLIVEDSESDAALVVRHLTKAGYNVEFERIEMPEEMSSALSRQPWDIIISDFKMPRFSATEALAMALASGRDIPFIVVSGTIGEETAVALMRAGAHDYVMKDKLARLASAVKRELAAAVVRNDRRQAEANLKDMMKWQEAIFEGSRDAIFVLDSDTRLVAVNRAACTLTGYSKEELLRMRFPEVQESDNPNTDDNHIMSVLGGEEILYEAKIRRKDGSNVEAELNGARMLIGTTAYIHTTARDITERKQAELALSRERNLLRSLMDSTPDHIYFKDTSGRFIAMNAALAERFGLKDPSEGVGKTDADFFTNEHAQQAFQDEQEVIRSGVPLVGVVEKETWSDRPDSWVSTTKIPLRDDRGAVVGIIGISRDFTQVKKAEQALLETNVRYETFINASTDMVFLKDDEFRHLVVNDALCRFFAKDRTDLIGKTDFDLMDRQHAEKCRESDTQALRQAAPIISIETIGDRIYETRKFPVKLGVNRIGIGGYVRDITARKKAEEAVRESEERYRELVELSPDAIIVHCDGKIVFANPASVRLARAKDASDLIGRSALGFVHPEYRKFAADRIARTSIHRTAAPLAEERFVALDGTEIEVEVTAISMQYSGKPAVQAIIRDITDRKRAETAVRQSEQKFRSVWNSSADGMRLTDRDGRIIDVNQSYCAMVRVPREKLIGSIFSIVYRSRGPHDDLTEYRERFDDGRVISHVIAPATLWDGDELYLDISNSVMHSEDHGRMVLSIFRDVTERKKMEAALVASEERYRRLFEESKDAIYMSTAEGTLIDVNPAAVELFGCQTKAEAMQIDIVHDLHVEAERREEFMRQMETDGFVKDFEFRLRQKTGKILTVLETATGVQDTSKRTVMYRGILRDVTRQRDLERDLMQAQKLESIGTLAGGIAHDFNNILGIILGHLSLLERVRDKPEQFAQSSAAVLKAVDRGAALVRQILTFARRTEAEAEPVHVTSAVKELVRLLGETFPKTITIVTDLEKAIPIIMIDQTQLHQALLNLCVNARDAIMDPSSANLGRGTITIAAKAIKEGELKERFPEAAPVSYVQISISDTGIGMSEDTKQRMYEPFFTTKELGKGTGLGLSVVYGIVKAQGGFIDVESDVGRGTSFYLYLPVAATQTPSAQIGKPSGEEVRGGRETLLFVEDEENLLSMMRSALEARGYTVLTAKDGIEAIRLYSSNKETIALVFSDLGLPKLDGIAVFRSIREINPSIRVILASGYIEPESKSQLLRTGAKEFIQKPYDPNLVLKKVREVLDAGG